MIKNRWFELHCPSDYNHWCFYFSLPSTDTETEVWGVYRAKLIIAFWKFFLSLNLWKVTPWQSDSYLESYKRYGITFFDRSIHLHWKKTWVKFLPWDWEIHRWDLLLPNGEVYYRNQYSVTKNQGENNIYSWYEILDGHRVPQSHDPVPDNATETVEIIHRAPDGSIQRAHITLCGEEREWRWRWFTWLPWPRMIKRTVDCSSDIQIGARAGSWKGGMTGWSCDWKQGESMKKAFWRWYSTWDGK